MRNRHEPKELTTVLAVSPVHIRNEIVAAITQTTKPVFEWTCFLYIRKICIYIQGGKQNDYLCSRSGRRKSKPSYVKGWNYNEDRDCSF